MITIVGEIRKNSKFLIKKFQLSKFLRLCGGPFGPPAGAAKFLNPKRQHKIMNPYTLYRTKAFYYGVRDFGPRFLAPSGGPVF